MGPNLPSRATHSGLLLAVARPALVLLGGELVPHAVTPCWWGEVLGDCERSEGHAGSTTTSTSKAMRLSTRERRTNRAPMVRAGIRNGLCLGQFDIAMERVTPWDTGCCSGDCVLGGLRVGVIGMSVRKWVARHELGLFFVLAFLLSWAIWPLVLLNSDSSPLVPFGPLMAALIVTALSEGGQGVAALMRKMSHWRVNPLWYAVALIGPFVLTALAGAAAVAAGAPSPGLGVYSDWSGILTSLLATAVLIGIFEEVGWRGFALPRMQRNHAALSAALLLGMIWAVWHLPELVSDPSERELVPYLLAVLAYSVLITWLYNSTRGNLPIVILFHAAINTAAKFLMPEFESQYEATAWWCYAAVYVFAAVAVIAIAGASRLNTGFPRRDRVQAGPEAADEGQSTSTR